MKRNTRRHGRNSDGRKLLGALLAATLAACGIAIGEHAEPSDYNQSCSVDSDCAPVWQKSCDDPGCNCTPAGAVNRQDVQKYNADEDQVQCTPLPPASSVAICECATFVAFCSSGTCAVRNASLGGSGG